MAACFKRNLTQFIRVQPLCPFGMKTTQVMGLPLYIFEFDKDGCLELPVSYTTYRFRPAGKLSGIYFPFPIPAFDHTAVARRIHDDPVVEINVSDFALVETDAGIKLYLRETHKDFWVFNMAEAVTIHPQDRPNIEGEIDQIRDKGGVWRSRISMSKEGFQEWALGPRSWRRPDYDHPQIPSFDASSGAPEDAPSVGTSVLAHVPRTTTDGPFGDKTLFPLGIPVILVYGPICSQATIDEFDRSR